MQIYQLSWHYTAPGHLAISVDHCNDIKFVLFAGALSTCAALGLGLKNFLRNDHRKQQMFMRARVGAQGFTVLALVGGVFYEAMKY